MRWASLFMASWLTVSMSQAPAAQVGTAEGVAALARGDYLDAAAILKPIAEGWRQSDPMAQFFMGTLYETGRGVPQDLIRACALYQRATGAWGTPFGEEAGKLFKALIFSHDAEWNQDCQLLANIGFDHGFEPVTFTFEAGHSIAWDWKGATVTYQGKSRRFPIQLASRGSVFFPIRQTELVPGVPGTGPRTFCEVFVWRPSADGRSWELGWHLFEVVRDELIAINVGSDPVVTLQRYEPPGPLFFDVRAYVDVRRTADGDAEWVVLQGPRARSGTIETDAERRALEAERQERLERDRVRSAASKLVDWKREQDANRPPSMAYVDADGCGAVELYGWSADRAEAITLHVDQRGLQLPTGPSTVDIARQGRAVSVTIHIYAVPRRAWPFCSDVGQPPGDGAAGRDETWRAVSGTIAIELSPPAARTRSPRLYRATVRLANAEFINGSGTRVRQSQPIVLSAMVGGWGG